MARRDASLVRRIAPAVALTGVGVMLVNVLDRPTPELGADGGLSVAGVTDTSVAVSMTGPAPTPLDSAAATAGPVASTVPAIPGVTLPVATLPVASQAPAAAAPSNVCGAVTSVGSTTNITERRTYGTIVVTASFTGDGTLCAASANYSVNDRRSRQIEAYVVPILNDQVAATQSARVNGVSGATAVSDAYTQSLQYAIDHKA